MGVADIVLFERYPVMRLGIRAVIAKMTDIDCSVENAREETLLSLCRNRQPCTVITTDDLSQIDLPSFIELMKNSRCRVLVYGSSRNLRFIKRLAKAGVSGYVWRGDVKRELCFAIRRVIGGERYFSTTVNLSFSSSFSPDYVNIADALSPAERSVVKMTAEGVNYKEMALYLKVSLNSVYNYRQTAMQKLGVSTNADIVKVAIISGMSSLRVKNISPWV